MSEIEPSASSEEAPAGSALHPRALIRLQLRVRAASSDRRMPVSFRLMCRRFLTCPGCVLLFGLLLRVLEFPTRRHKIELHSDTTTFLLFVIR